MFVESDSNIWQSVSRVAMDEGLALYDLERITGGLRVFVERDENISSCPSENGLEESKQANADSEDCARLCRRLVTFFSVEGAGLGVGAETSLEVSSPGISRHLRLERHFCNAIGKKVKVQFQDGFVDSKRTVLGALERFENNTIFVCDSENALEEGVVIEIPLGSIVKARVEFSFGSSGRTTNEVRKNGTSSSKRSSKENKLKTLRH